MKTETPAPTPSPLPPVEDTTIPQRVIERAGRIWQESVFRAGARVGAQKQKFDWKNPEHYQIALEEIAAAGPGERLARILKESADYAAGLNPTQEPTLGSWDALFGAMAGSFGLNAPQMMRRKIFQRKDESGLTIADKYLDAWRKVHPEEQKRFVEQSDRFLSVSSWDKLKAYIGSDIAAEMFAEFPPDYSTIEALRPVLGPGHRKFWDDLKAGAIQSQVEALKEGGGKFPDQEHYEKKRAERIEKGGAQRSPFLEGPDKDQQLPGRDTPPISPEDATQIFIAHLVHDPASAEIQALHEKHPWLQAMGASAAMVTQWMGASTALKAGAATTKWALPQLLKKLGLKAASVAMADRLARVAGLVAGSRGTQLAAETLAYEASRAVTQEVSNVEHNTTVWDALLSAALMGGVGKMSQTFVEAWAQRKMATHVAEMLQKKVPLEGGRTLTERLGDLLAQPVHKQALVEFGALEITHKAFELGKRGLGQDIEGEDFGEFLARVLSTAGFGFLASLGSTSRKMPWWRYEKGTLERRIAQTEEGLRRLDLRGQLGKIQPGGKTVGEALREVYGPEAIEQNLQEIRQVSAKDARLAEMVKLTPEQVAEQRKAETQRREEPPSPQPQTRIEGVADAQGIVPKPAEPEARPTTKDSPALSPKGEPNALKPEVKSGIDEAIERHRRSLWTARDIAGATRLTDPELDAYERLTKALVYHQAKATVRPEAEIWRDLGLFKGVSKESREAMKGKEYQQAKALFKVAQKLTYLFDTADLTALVHEQGHALRFMLSPKQTGLVWSALGAKPGANLTRVQEEQFAKQYQHFLEAGQAPSKKLQPVFEQVKGYLDAAKASFGGGAAEPVQLPGGKTAEALPPVPEAQKAIGQAFGARGAAGKRVAPQPQATEPPGGRKGGEGIGEAESVAPTAPAPQEIAPKRAVTQKGAEAEPSGFKFAGKKSREAIGKQIELTRLTVSKSKKAEETHKLIDEAEKASTWHESLDALSRAKESAGDFRAEMEIGRLVESIPLPPKVSAVKGAKEAVQSLVLAPAASQSPKSMKDTLAEISEHGVAGVSHHSDGTWELVTKSGLRVQMLASDVPDTLFMLSPEPPKSDRQAWIESYANARATVAVRLQRFLAKSPFGGRFMSRWWGKMSGIGADEVIGKFQKTTKEELAKRQAVFAEVMAGIHHTKSQADRTAMYEALWEGTVENLPEHLRPTMAKAAETFLWAAEVLYRNGFLTEENLAKPYAPLLPATMERMGKKKNLGKEMKFQEREISDMLALTGAILRGFGQKRSQPLGHGMIDRITNFGIRSLLATNLKKRSTETLEEARAKGFQISAEAILPALQREIRAGVELEALERIAEDPYLSRSTEPPPEESHRWELLPKDKKWGAAKGRWINKDLLGTVNRLHKEVEGLQSFWQAIHGLAKSVLTVPNPALHLTQMVSNPILANMAGLQILGKGAKDIGWAMSNIWKANRRPGEWAPDATIREMIEHGVITLDDFQHSAFQDQQLRSAMEGHLHSMAVAFDQGNSVSGFGHLGATVYKAAQFALAEGMRPVPFKKGPSVWRAGRAALSLGDMGYGMALYRQLRTGTNKWGFKFDPEMAGKIASTVLMRRATTPPLVKALTQLVSFGAFPAKLIVETPYQVMMTGAGRMPFVPKSEAGKRAWIAAQAGLEMTKWALIANGLHYFARRNMGLTEEEYEKSRLEAAFMDEFSAQFLLGIGHDKNGKPVFLDMKGLVFPWATLVDPFRRGHWADQPVMQFASPSAFSSLLSRVTTPAWWLRQNVLLSRAYEATVLGETYYGDQLHGPAEKLWHLFGSPFVPIAVRTTYKAIDRGLNPRGIRTGADYARQLIGLRIETPSREKRILGTFNELVERGRIGFFRLPFGAKGDYEAKRAVKEKLRMGTEMKRRSEGR